MADNKCRATVKQLNCGSELPNQTRNIYPAFDICLPLGYALSWDGYGLRLSGSSKVADGVYGLVTVQNGCITDLSEQPVCEYTAQPCTPAASGCGDTAGSATLQPDASNILNYDSSGRLGAQINYEAGSGVSMSGYGTASSPLKISFAGSSGGSSSSVKSGNVALTVTGTGSADDPYYVSHASTPLEAGTYNGITVDSYGHVTDIEEPATAVTAVMSNGTLTVTNNGTVYSIVLPDVGSLGTYTWGGFSTTVDSNGRITAVEQAITVPAGTYDGRYYNFSINDLGSVTAIEEHSREAEDIFCMTFTGNRQETKFTFTTGKSAFFKIHYRGRLAAPTTSTSGWVGLPAPFYVRVNEVAQAALAHNNVVDYVTEDKDGNLINNYTTTYDEVYCLTTAYYGAGTYTVELMNNTDDYVFPDTAILEVSLVSRGD